MGADDQMDLSLLELCLHVSDPATVVTCQQYFDVRVECEMYNVSRWPIIILVHGDPHFDP